MKGRVVGSSLLLLVGGIRAQNAINYPTIDTLPFHLFNYSTELVHKSGSGTNFVNFTSSYPNSLNGAKVILTDDQNDSLLMRIDLDSALNMKTTSLDTNAVVTLGLN